MLGTPLLATIIGYVRSRVYDDLLTLVLWQAPYIDHTSRAARAAFDLPADKKSPQAVTYFPTSLRMQYRRR